MTADDREDLRQVILDLYAYMAEKPDEGPEFRIDHDPQGT